MWLLSPGKWFLLCFKFCLLGQLLYSAPFELLFCAAMPARSIGRTGEFRVYMRQLHPPEKDGRWEKENSQTHKTPLVRDSRTIESIR